MTGVSLTGIDFRPTTAELYGYDGDTLYKINLTTGAATLAFDVGNAPGTVGFNFDPTLGRLIRIATPNGGAINTVGSLGIGAFSAITGVDIITSMASTRRFSPGWQPARARASSTPSISIPALRRWSATLAALRSWRWH